MDEYNRTALHIAAWKGQEAVAVQLLQAKASVTAVDNDGWTPLHRAAYNGEAQVVDLLLQANASPTAVDKDGRTPTRVAKQRGHTELAEGCARLSKPRPRCMPWKLCQPAGVCGSAVCGSGGFRSLPLDLGA